MSTLPVASPLRRYPAGMDLPSVRRVPFAAPFRWLRDGAHDLFLSWPYSLFYGALFSVIGSVLLRSAESIPHLAMALASGFFLIAPLLATVFYCASHRIEHQHRPPRLLEPFISLRSNFPSLGMFAVFLFFVLISWERVSAILVALFLSGSGIAGLDELLRFRTILAHPDFYAAYFAFGGALAFLIFALSAVSLPMMTHRKVDIATAMTASLQATRANLPAMALWAALIAILGFFGVLTGFIAMVFIFPWLGHSTWRSYRDLIDFPGH